MSLWLRNLIAAVILAGTGGVLIPWWILTSTGATLEGAGLPGIAVIAVGVGLDLWCLRNFAAVGQGTPGPWDAPRHLVAVGPFRWVRNPIYLGALTVVLGEAWLFLSALLMVYVVAMAIVFHLFVIGYEEPTLLHRFGETYSAYVRAVPRWIPRLPRRG